MAQLEKTCLASVRPRFAPLYQKQTNKKSKNAQSKKRKKKFRNSLGICEKLYNANGINTSCDITRE
jgi:hypothetical protein